MLRHILYNGNVQGSHPACDLTCHPLSLSPPDILSLTVLSNKEEMSYKISLKTNKIHHETSVLLHGVISLTILKDNTRE